MWGIFIGDCAGSEREVLEFEASKNNHSRYIERMSFLKEAPLFTDKSIKTDDTIMSISIMKSLMKKEEYFKTLREDARDEIEKGRNELGWQKFSTATCKWACSEEVYYGTSNGNGAAMRSGAIGLFFDSLEEVEKQARLSALPTHSTEEGIIGAQAVASSVFLLSNGASKESLIAYLGIRFSYNFNYNLWDIQRNNNFECSASSTVPLAIYAFLLSSDFENGLRIALSMGGDTDTISAIAGALLEAYYGVPDYLKDEVSKYLSEEDIEITNRFYNMVNEKKKNSVYALKMNRRNINNQ